MLRNRRRALLEAWATTTPVVVCFVTLDILVLWFDDWSGLWWSGQTDPHIVTMWILAGVVACYVAWIVLFTRGWLTTTGSPGFLIAILGVECRLLGDCLFSLPDNPWAPSSGLKMITAEQAFDPVHFRVIVALARHGGLAACLLGLLIVAAFAVQDFRARYRARERRYGRGIIWPRWF